MKRTGAVDFEVSAHEAYAYLVEPLNRPQWQSSLRTVVVPATHARGAAAAGLRWVDVTWPGLRPLMELTEAEPGVRWSESGHWHGVEAELTLRFEPRDSSGREQCRVVAQFEVWLPGAASRMSGVLTALAVPAVLDDLRRAARLLREGEGG